MAQPYVGEVKAFSFNYQPEGWLPCDGRLLPIRDNQMLFALIGPIYGGDGVSTFALPKIPPLATDESGASLEYSIAVTGAFPPR